MPQLTLLNHTFVCVSAFNIVYPTLSDKVYVDGYCTENVNDPAFFGLSLRKMGRVTCCVTEATASKEYGYEVTGKRRARKRVCGA
jgi:hypothetical protein